MEVAEIISNPIASGGHTTKYGTLMAASTASHPFAPTPMCLAQLEIIPRHQPHLMHYLDTYLNSQTESIAEESSAAERTLTAKSKA